MTPVLFTFVTPDGLPVADTTVEIQLMKSGFDNDITGVIMPRPVVVKTDLLGQVTVPLTPTPTLYVVTVEDKTSEAVLSYKFIVPVMEDPDAVVRMQDIVVQGPVSDTIYDEAAILVIHAAKANAMAAQVGAETARDEAQLAASSIGTQVADAAGSATAAAASQVAAAASETAAGDSEEAANTSATNAGVSAAAASGSEYAAANSATLASTRAAAALASQVGAAASELSASKMVPIFSATAPVDPIDNAEWIDANTGRRYSWINDGTSSQWVETGSVASVGADIIATTALSASQAAASATAAATSASQLGLAGALVRPDYHLIITRTDGSSYDAGPVRGPQGAPFSVDAIGPDLAARAAYDTQADGFSFLNTGAGNLYFREGGTSGVWSTAIPFGKGEKGDTGTTDYTELSNKPPLGTAAPLNVPASGNAATTEVVKGNDTRLSDARTPTAHTHTGSQISDATATGLLLLKAATVAAARSTLLVDLVNNTADADKPISALTATALAGKEPSIATGATTKFFRGDKTWQTLTKADVGLTNVDNTADASKSVNFANSSTSATKAGTLGSGGIGGGGMTFTWTDPGSGGGYVWCGDGATSMFVRPVSGLNVSRAATCGTADNANAVTGISGFNYSNRNYNPPYLWATAGAGNDQFLVTPGNLSVNYANSANTCNSAGNANLFQGQDGNYWLNNASSAARNVRNWGGAGMTMGVSGFGDMNFAWTSVSDERLKEDIEPTQQDSLTKVKRIDWKQFNFKEAFKQYGSGLQKLGGLAQQFQAIDDQWVLDGTEGEYLHPHQYNLLMAALHGLSQAGHVIDGLEARITVLEANNK